MYQYCCTNWRGVAQSRTDHPDINPWHLRAPAVILVYNITFITLSSKKPWDPFIFMYVKEPHLAVRGMYPGHSNVISTSLIHSRSLITSGTIALPPFKILQELEGDAYNHIGSILTSLPPFLAEETQMIFLTWRFAHFRKPHHHINSEKEIKTYSPTWGLMCLMSSLWTLLSASTPSSGAFLPAGRLPSSCPSSAFETAFRAPP